MSFLDRISPDQVRAHPFPHVVVDNFLDPALCDHLIAQFPRTDIITRGQRPSTRTKYYLNVKQSQSEWRIAPLWKQTLLDFVQPSIWHNVVRIFGDSLLGEYPDFEERYGPLTEFRIGTRRIDDFADKNVLLDSKAKIHTPTAGAPQIERLPHLKFFGTVFLAYIFLRADDDHSEGAEFEFYSSKPGSPVLLGPRHTVGPEQVQVESRVPYRKNTLVMFLNTARSFQGIAARSASTRPYMVLHLTANLRSFLYNHDFLPGAQVDATPTELMYPPHRPSLGERVSYRWRRVTGRF